MNQTLLDHWQQHLDAKRRLEAEQKPLFDAWWQEHFEPIHPNWRTSEMGPSVYFHAFNAWCAAIEQERQKDES